MNKSKTLLNDLKHIKDICQATLFPDSFYHLLIKLYVYGPSIEEEFGQYNPIYEHFILVDKDPLIENFFKLECLTINPCLKLSSIKVRIELNQDFWEFERDKKE